jgi:hypothetical protein
MYQGVSACVYSLCESLCECLHIRDDDIRRRRVLKYRISFLHHFSAFFPLLGWFGDHGAEDSGMVSEVVGKWFRVAFNLTVVVNSECASDSLYQEAYE